MGSDFDKHGEEARTHPFVENLDDASEYISAWGMSKEGILALPHPIRGYCHESFGISENHNGLVVCEGIFKSQTCCRKFGPVGRAATDASPNPAAPEWEQAFTDTIPQEVGAAGLGEASVA